MTKRCPGCDQVKALDDFGRRTVAPDGRHPRCFACVTSYKVYWRQHRAEFAEKTSRRRMLVAQYKEVGMKLCSRCKEPRPIQAFLASRQHRDGLGKWCFSCRRVYWRGVSPRPRQDLRIVLSETEKAYIAGIVDGEGTVSIGFTSTHCARVYVANTNMKLIEWLQRRVGGRIKTVPRSHPNHKTVYYWRPSHRLALVLLGEIRPYLVIKDQQSELVVRFFRERDEARLQLGGKKFLFKENLLPQFASIVSDVRALNKRGVI